MPTLDLLGKILGMVITGVPFVLGASFVLVRYVTDPIAAKLNSHIEKDELIHKNILDAIDRIEKKMDRLTDYLIERRL
jgi:type III secretory pathway component EscR